MPSATRAGRPGALVVEHLDRHQLRPERDADHAACRWPPRRSCPPRGCRARAVVQVAVGVRGREVDAVDVVDVAVAVVVDAVARHLGEVRPHVRREVRVVELHARSRRRRRPRPRPADSAHAPGRSNTVPGANAHCSPCSASVGAAAAGAANDERGQPWQRPEMGSDGASGPLLLGRRPYASNVHRDQPLGSGHARSRWCSSRSWSGSPPRPRRRSRCASRRLRTASPTRAAAWA